MVSSLDLLAVPLLIQPRRLLASGQGTDLAHAQLPTEAVSAELLASLSFPIPGCRGVGGRGLPFAGQHSAFLLSELLTILFSTFLQPVFTSLEDSSTFQHINWPLSFRCYSANQMSVDSTASSELVTKTLSRMGPRLEVCSSLWSPIVVMLLKVPRAR